MNYSNLVTRRNVGLVMDWACLLDYHIQCTKANSISNFYSHLNETGGK